LSALNDEERVERGINVPGHIGRENRTKDSVGLPVVKLEAREKGFAIMEEKIHL